MRNLLVLRIAMLSLGLLANTCQPAKTSTIAPAHTATPRPPTRTPVVPTPTETPLPPEPTATPVPPTETPVPLTPTATALPPLTGSGGGRILFSSRRGEGDYEVYVMNADGSDKRQLTHDTLESENPAWSPDGTRFVYTLDDYSGGSDIYLRNADGSGKRRLTRGGNTAGGAWSPDGAHVTVDRNAPGGGSDLYLLAVPELTGAGGGGEQRLTDLGNLGVLNPSWSPDGRHIVVVVDADPDPQSWELSLYVLAVDDALRSGGADLTEMRPLPRIGESLNDWPAWSPVDDQIAFSAVVGGHRDIFLVHPDGTGLQQLTRTPDFDEFAPAWSPDGTHIVFQANPNGQWDIYTMKADGSDRRQLTTDPANDTAPSWAP